MGNETATLHSHSLTRYTAGAKNTNYISSNLALLRSKIENRNRIYPADLDKMRQMYNDFISHSHTYYDQGFVEFGNLGYVTKLYSRAAETLQSRGAPVLSSVISGGRTGHRILTDRVRIVVDTFRTWCHAHYHRVTDVSDTDTRP